MAHELEFVNGEASMAYAGELPWHGLGTKVPADLTPVQMLEAAHLDWKVEKVPLYADYNGQRVFTGKDALVRDRDGDCLDVVSQDWNPVQNLEAFEFFNEFVAAGDMNMDTAGSLYEGKVVWALAKVNDSFELFGGKDKVDSYLLFTNPHQYGSSLNVRMTATRVVCANTLSLSLSQKAKTEVRLNHRRKFDADTVKEMMGVSHEKMLKYKEMAEFLTTKRYTGESMTDYFKHLFPLETAENGVNRNGQFVMNDLVESQAGAELGAGSFWQLYNAVTNFTSHHASRTEDARVHSLWYGAGRDLNLKALHKAVEMANA